jgi:hypothetical protein
MFDKKIFFTPLFSTCFWIRDPRSGIRDPGSGMGKNQDPGSATLSGRKDQEKARTLDTLNTVSAYSSGATSL